MFSYLMISHKLYLLKPSTKCKILTLVGCWTHEHIKKIPTKGLYCKTKTLDYQHRCSIFKGEVDNGSKIFLDNTPKILVMPIF